MTTNFKKSPTIVAGEVKSVPNFKCPICLRKAESKKEPKTIQLYGNGTEHAVCGSCADIVEMLRGGSPDDAGVLVVRLSVFHRALLARFAPFWGKTDAEVLKTLAMRWIEGNIGIPNIMMLCQTNERVKENCQTIQETPDKLVAISSSGACGEGGASVGAAVADGFVFRDCIGEPFAYDSLVPTTHGKTTYCLDGHNGMMRIERAGYPCAAHAYLADVLYLYNHQKEVRNLLKHIDHNRRPIITGFLKDVPVESLHLTKKEEKKECPEKDCINKNPTQCPFCTNKSRYENAKMKKRKELRAMVAKMGI